MPKLYIIGNGFDINHNLETGYDSFHQFIKVNYPDLENLFEEYFRLNTNKDNLWSDFENDLGTFNWKSFFDEINNIDIYDEKFRPSFVYCIEDELKQEADALIEQIKDAFQNWLNQIDLESTNIKIDFDSKGSFLNFNYTLTLEKVYKIPSANIFHIHGDIETNQNSLIFGHNKELTEMPEIDENGDSNRTMFTDSENAAKYPFYSFQKPVNEIISENKSFFESIRNIDEIEIYGHSLNQIDIPYFEEIIKQTNDSTNWKVSFHKEKERKTHLQTLLKLGINRNRIELFKMI
jgi:hypothetical protein